MRSVGQLLLPKGLHEKLQFDRYPITRFLREEVIPQMKDGDRVLDAGSGRIQEQVLRGEILATGAKLETLDMMAGDGVDHVGSAEEMPFGDNTFDVVLCTQVLEHVENPRAVCAELQRVTRPGGTVVVTAPQSAYLHNLPYHFFHYTNLGLKMILEDAGLEVERVECQGGHFMMLGQHLHYTSRVIDEFRTTPLRRIFLAPFSLLSRALFGFLFKLPLLWLDRVFLFEGNTQGWNVICKKQDADV